MMPKLDARQDWTLISASEHATTGKTYLKFTRLLNTCDEEDLAISVRNSKTLKSIAKVLKPFHCQQPLS
jgi:hypothetical protein